jgi:hypothetical protein
MHWQLFVFMGENFKQLTSQGAIMACMHMKKCSFFEAFSKRQSLVWQATIRNYCEGEAECERQRIYGSQDWENVPAELMPSGTYASKAFLSLL